MRVPAGRVYPRFEWSACQPPPTRLLYPTRISAVIAVMRTPLLAAAAVAFLLAGCAGERPENTPEATSRVKAVEGRAAISRDLPPGIVDRAGWVEDIDATFAALKISASREHVCAVIAVTEQESGFRVNPVIPDLGNIAWREIDTRAAHAGVPLGLVHGVLELTSPNGQSYRHRIEHARTEKELSDVFEDFTGSVPLGRTLFASWNPIRTRGPMQVNVAFAERFAQSTPYPFAVKTGIADELFTRRGSLYFGTAHLLDYAAPYDRYVYRFADFNAGQYSSRNAAFQRAVSSASGMPLLADGALLPQNGSSRAGNTPAGSTELAVRSLGKRLNLTEEAIHQALEQGRSEEFERSSVYTAVFELAERRAGRALQKASIPRIKLQGPKITRDLTTEWYALRVEQRFERCLNR
jgi:Protein of unknown function (DUF1615)